MVNQFFVQGAKRASLGLNIVEPVVNKKHRGQVGCEVPTCRGFSQVSSGPVVSLGGGNRLPASPGWGENNTKMKAFGQYEKLPYLCNVVVIV